MTTRMIVRVEFSSAVKAIECEEVLQILLAAGCIRDMSRVGKTLEVEFDTSNAARASLACSTFGATLMSVREPS